MKVIIQSKLILMYLLASTACSDEVIKLTDYQVMSINTHHPFEPSGLTLKHGQLFTVCDDSNFIYQVNILDDSNASAEPVIKIDLAELGASELDLEGLTTVGEAFYAVSEKHHKLIRVSDQAASWVPASDSIYQNAYESGLFQMDNAGLEAAAYMGDQTFLLTVERQPRGLIEVTFDDSFEQVIKQTNQLFDDSKYPVELSRKPDLTGLFIYDDVLYALHRNAYLIHELIKDENGHYQEGKAWSYEHIVKAPENAYQDMRFGHAEGLAVDADYFYLILDNNNNPKLKNPNNVQPLLIKVKRH